MKSVKDFIAEIDKLLTLEMLHPCDDYFIINRKEYFELKNRYLSDEEEK